MNTKMEPEEKDFAQDQKKERTRLITRMRVQMYIKKMLMNLLLIVVLVVLVIFLLSSFFNARDTDDYDAADIFPGEYDL